MKGIKFFYITCSKKKEAHKIAGYLVKNKLVACANIIHNVDSVFTWKGKVTKAKEILIVGKTINKNVQKIIKSVKKMKSHGTFKKGRKKIENNRTKNQIPIADSPFYSLKVLLKN